MKWASSIAEELSLEPALKECIKDVQSQLGPGPVDLAVLFVSHHYQGRYSEIPSQVMEGLGCKTLLGCSAGGIIGGGREVEHRPAISLTAARLPNVNLKPFHAVMEELPTLDASPKTWEEWAGLPTGGTSHFILLADPYTFNPESLLMGLDFAFPKSAKVGGLASGAAQGGQNALFLNEETYHTGLVGLALSGNVVIDTVVAQGCRPIGKPMHITESNQNLLIGLDHKKTIEILQELLETLDDNDRALMQHSLFLGIVMDPFKDKENLTRGDFLIRNLVGFDSKNGVLAVGALLHEGQTVQFHLRDSKTSAEDLELMLTRYLMEHNPKVTRGGLLFSCLGRGEHLYGFPNHDSNLFLSKIGPVPLGGFFCNGEIGAVGNSTYLHGYTSCFGIFRPLQTTS